MRVIARTPKGKMLVAWSALFVALIMMFSSMTVGFAETQNLVHASGDIIITPAHGEIVDYIGIDAGESSVVCKPGASPSFDVNIDDLAYPGAYALVRLTVINKGNLPATLVSIDTKAPDLDYIHLTVPATLEPGEVIAAGEICEFELLVRWDPDSTVVPDGKQVASFGVTLHYENNDYVVQQPSSGPKTGDETNAAPFFVLAGISAVAVILCLVFILRNKKKDKED